MRPTSRIVAQHLVRSKAVTVGTLPVDDPWQFDGLMSIGVPDDSAELPNSGEFDPNTPAAAMARLRDRLRAIHPHAAAIITAHAALKLEVDQVLRRFLARPDKLRRLSMEHQLGILRALLDDEWLDLVLEAISAYGAIRARTGEGRALAKANAKSLGRPFKMTAHQRKEALARRESGELLTEIARSYNVSAATISRLAAA